MVALRNNRSIRITWFCRGDELKICHDFTGKLWGFHAIEHRSDFEIYLTLWLFRVTRILRQRSVVFTHEIARRLPFSCMCHAKRINSIIRMNDRKSSLIHDSIVGDFLHREMNIPSSKGKLDSRRITFIFLASYAKSKIYQTWIMSRRLVSRYTRCKIKIHFTGILSDITGISRESDSIFLQEIGRLLKWPKNTLLFAKNSSKGKNTHQKHS
jgi:hypothetical protein